MKIKLKQTQLVVLEHKELPTVTVTFQYFADDYVYFEKKIEEMVTYSTIMSYKRAKGLIQDLRSKEFALSYIIEG